jgi:hypothetical protein
MCRTCSCWKLNVPDHGQRLQSDLTIQALAYMSADALVNRYRKNPGALI